MNDEVYNIQAIPGQPLRDQFADIGALSCMLADALEEHREGDIVEAKATLNLAMAIGSNLDSHHFNTLFQCIFDTIFPNDRS